MREHVGLRRVADAAQAAQQRHQAEYRHAGGLFYLRAAAETGIQLFDAEDQHKTNEGGTEECHRNQQLLPRKRRRVGNLGKGNDAGIRGLCAQVFLRACFLEARQERFQKVPVGGRFPLQGP